jgi:hypothetical protein
MPRHQAAAKRIRPWGIRTGKLVGLISPTSQGRVSQGRVLNRLVRRRFVTVIALFGAVAALYAQPLAQTLELDVKAAYLLNFGRFGTWPANATDNAFTICVLGSDPFGARLDSVVSGERIAGRPVAVKRITTVAERDGCRILFISSSEEPRLATIVAALANAPVLTVSDIPQFLDRGGMIQFVTDGRRVRFDVNVVGVNASGLMLSSELLRVAARVRK